MKKQLGILASILLVCATVNCSAEISSSNIPQINSCECGPDCACDPCECDD